MWCIQANYSVQAIPVISCKLRKFQKSLLCSTVTVVPCTSEKERAILVQFETWKLIFVDKKGGNKFSGYGTYLTSGAVREVQYYFG
ncbi:hypothetical protein T12_10201 [Trichinella patagoniensis]|uniref:Uncharacterized protein n=1 Tax=Trichinella patagoniensis TaxID=990121 RepID=A0A0V0ZJ63_9BILA|nr:hypothetical protein T12_10201 [Trichinella patagoniensis]